MIRVEIIEAGGLKLDDVFPGALKDIVLHDGAPEHVGKKGVLLLSKQETVIWTDDGFFVRGSDCWYVPIEE